MTTNDLDVQLVLAEMARQIGQLSIDLAIAKAQLAAAAAPPE